MVSKTYLSQFTVISWDNADSRSVAYLIGKSHSVMISQIQKLNLEFEVSSHLCIRRSGKSFQSPCIRMKKSEWMAYLMTIKNQFRQKIMTQLLDGVSLGDINLEL